MTMLFTGSKPNQSSIKTAQISINTNRNLNLNLFQKYDWEDTGEQVKLG